jgi:hypothetical protein
MSSEARPIFPPLRRRSIARRLAALFLLVGALASASAALPRQVGAAPSPRPARGGGPQTGTGTSDAVRTIVPAKNRGRCG